MSGLWTPPDANRGLPPIVGGFRRDTAAEPVRGAEPGARVYRRGHLLVIVGRHPESRRWHLSISLPDRTPTWEQIRDARYSLLPDGITVAMILPPRGEYLNVHEHCFHLHQVTKGEEVDA